MGEATIGESIAVFTQHTQGVYSLHYTNGGEVLVSTNNVDSTVDDRVVPAMSWLFISADGKESAQ